MTNTFQGNLWRAISNSRIRPPRKTSERNLAHIHKATISIAFLLIISSCKIGQEIRTPSFSSSTQTPIGGSSPTTGLFPLGEYACQGHEYGLIASIGMVTFMPDGGFVDQAFYYPPSPGIAGTWYFDPGVQRIYFSDNIDFAYAEYDAIEDAATLYLREGITRAHADGGVILCFKSED